MKGRVRPEGYFFVRDAAKQLELSPSKIRALADEGVLAGARTPSGYRLIDKESVAAYRPHLSTGDVAELLGVHPDRVRAMFDTGRLQGFRTEGGTRWVDPASLPEG